MDMIKAIKVTGRINDSDRSELEKMEQRDSCFPAVNPEWWKQD